MHSHRQSSRPQLAETRFFRLTDRFLFSHGLEPPILLSFLYIPTRLDFPDLLRIIETLPLEFLPSKVHTVKIDNMHLNLVNIHYKFIIRFIFVSNDFWTRNIIK